MSLVCGVLAHFKSKTHKKCLTYQFFMCQTILIFPNIYTIHKKNGHILAQKIGQEKLIKGF